MLAYTGASNGITKNFETVREVLKDFVTVRDAGKAPPVKVFCWQRCPHVRGKYICATSSDKV